MANRYFILLILVIFSNSFADNSLQSISSIKKIPPQLQIRSMPEWEESEGIIIAWNNFEITQNNDEENNFLEPVDFDKVLAEIVKHAQKQVIVYIITINPDYVRDQLNFYNVKIQENRVVFINRDFNTIWCRDYGPNSVYYQDIQSLCLVDWIYSAKRLLDDKISEHFSTLFSVDLYEGSEFPYDLESDGGNFMTDGNGTAVTTRLMLKQNQHKTAATIRLIHKEFMGIDNLIILPNEYHVHIDLYMKFINENTLLVGEYPQGTKNVLPIEENLNFLQEEYLNATGEKYNIIRIPMPKLSSGYYFTDEENFWSYTNSIILNKSVLVPVFGIPEDDIALDIYKQAMPGYEIIGIDCDDVMLTAGGALHCLIREIGVKHPIYISHDQREDIITTEQGVFVNAIIQSYHSILDVELHYKSPDQKTFKQVEMQIAKDHFYSAKLPASFNSAEIQYYFSVSNTQKNITKPFTAPDNYFTLDPANTTLVNEQVELPDSFELLPAFPNPFNPVTTISFKINKAKNISITIYNIDGRLVTELINEHKKPGNYQIHWNASDLASGTYFIQFKYDQYIQIQKCLLIK